RRSFCVPLIFFCVTCPTPSPIFPLSLHDALPISSTSPWIVCSPHALSKHRVRFRIHGGARGLPHHQRAAGRPVLRVLLRNLPWVPTHGRPQLRPSIPRYQ